MAIKSATGAAAKMPSISKARGKVQTSGTKQIMSLIKDVEIANTGLPTA